MSLQALIWHRTGHALLVAVVAVTLLAGCVGKAARPASDSAEALFATTEDQARAALIKVLAENGYGVTVEQDGRLIRTDYRQETDGPWDRLIVYRFGTVRSWVEATVAPEPEQDAIRVKIDVFVEGKDSLLGSWEPFDAPLPQRAATHLRQVRIVLDVL